VTYCSGPGIGDFVLYNNQFVYSPNQLFAVGVFNYTFGVYHASAYGSIGAPIGQYTGPFFGDPCFAVQTDLNVVW
jgi:hypothetical protein